VDASQCLSLHADDVQQCSSPPSAVVLSHDAAERQAADRAGARYIDVTPWFCSSTCSDVIGRYEPYWDRFHLTRDYSIALERVLGNALDLAPGT
jgi:hypothetical protein